MNMIARIAAIGLLLTGLSFAKHPKYRWRGDDRTAYRMYDRGYRGQWDNPSRWKDGAAYRYRSYRYRDDRGLCGAATDYLRASKKISTGRIVAARLGKASLA